MSRAPGRLGVALLAAAAVARLPVLGLASASLLLSACGDDDDAAAGAATPEAADLVAAAASRMEQVRSFHFELEHENGSTQIVRGIAMERAVGDIVGVDRLRPHRRGPRWPARLRDRHRHPARRELDPEPNHAALGARGDLRGGALRPGQRRRRADALGRRAHDRGRERIAGVETYRVSTEVESGELTVFPGAEPGRLVPATAWIGVDDPLVHRLEVRGPISDGEEDDIARRLDLSDFDADFDIAPPPLTAMRPRARSGCALAAAPGC